MKVDFNRSALSEALALVGSVVPSRTPKPILKCVQITAEGKEVRICATDLEVGVSCVVSEVEVREAGEVLVPADRLTAIVRESADDVLVLEAADGTCEVKGADSHFTIYGHEGGQYPTVPAFDGKADLEVGLNVLQVGIEKVLFATARESSRYAINGVLWQIKDKKLVLVATDGRRLARCRVKLGTAPEKGEGPEDIIVPAKTMGLLEKIGSNEKDTVAIRLVDNQILLSCANVVISSNLVEGNFPKYEDIIPADHDKKIKLSKDAALSAVRRSSLLTSEESRGIKLSIAENKVIFSGRAPEAGDAEIEMPVEYSGEPISIGFNPNYLIDVLRVIQESEVDLELGQSDRPGVVRSGADFLCVLMPISLG